MTDGELIEALRKAGSKFQTLAGQLEIYETGRMIDPKKRLELAELMTVLADEIETLLADCESQGLPVAGRIQTAVPILRSDAATLRAKIS